MLNGMKFVEGPFVDPIYNKYRGPINLKRIGSDPEFFSKRGEDYIVPDSILNKKIDKHNGINGMIFGDGPAYEIYVYPTNINIKMFEEVKYSVSCLRQTAKHEDNCSISIEPQVEFEKNYWDSLPDFVKDIGCSPDIYLWPSKNGYWIKEADQEELDNVRYAGGHIHLEFTGLTDSFTDVLSDSDEKYIVSSDFMHHYASLAIGLFTSEIFPFLLDEERRAFGKLNYKPRFASRYGVPILCRIKPYGVEIRCVSNWIVADERRNEELVSHLRRVFLNREFVYPEIDFSGVHYGEELEELVKEFRKEFLSC